MCNKCKGKHSGNPRLASHKIVNYQQMIFNGNKFGKRDDSANNSRSPTRRGTAIGNPPTDISQKGKSPNATANKMNTDGVSMISANSSGRFSLR